MQEHQLFFLNHWVRTLFILHRHHNVQAWEDLRDLIVFFIQHDIMIQGGKKYSICAQMSECLSVLVRLSVCLSVCLSVYLSQCSRCVSCLSLYLSVVLSRGVSLHCNGLFFYLCLLAPEEWIYLLTNGSHPSRFSTGNNMTQLCSAVCKSHHPAFSNIWWHM